LAKPWNAEHSAGNITAPCARRQGGHRAHRGINVLLLWSEGSGRRLQRTDLDDLPAGCELGAQVRKGERGALVVFADRFTKTDTDDKGEAVEKQIPFMKGYTVFNVEQIEGFAGAYYAKPSRARQSPGSSTPRRSSPRTGATIKHGGNRAFYAPGSDFVQMPPRESFR